MKLGKNIKKNKIIVAVNIMILILIYLTLIPVTSLGNNPTLVGRWQFDEGTGTTVGDTSGNCHNGTIVDPTWITGKMGKALQFSGNGYVEISHNATLNPRNALTIEAWINPATNMQWRKVISKSLNKNTDYSIFQGADNNLAFSIKMGSMARTVYAPANSVPLGEWTYLVGTYDGTRMRLYLNGAQVNSIAISGEINCHTEPLRIGGDAPGAYFEGQIDEVSIYNAALSAAEIRERYEAFNYVPAPTVLEAVTTADGNKILITFDKEMDNPPAAPDGFVVTIDEEERAIRDIDLNSSNNAVLELTMCNPLFADDPDIQLAYTAGNVKAADGGTLADFSNFSVLNRSTAPLAGRWQFNEGEGAVAADTSGNGNDGTVNGPVWITGRVGNALEFSGDGCVEIPHQEILSPRNAMTIEAWIKPETTVRWRKVISKSLGSHTDYSIFQGAENNLAFSFKTGSVARTVYAPANSTPLGEWKYVVGAYDGTRMRLYLNGVQVNSIAISGEINYHAEPLRIGGEPGAYFAGQIDEVSVYNAALSAARIQERYESFCETNTDAIIIPTAANFDKFNPSDVTVTMELNGKSLIGLKNGETQLIKGTDYTVSGNMVTINQAYLTQQPIGTTNIAFDFSAGNDPVLAITIADTSTPEGPILFEAATTTDGTKILLTFDRAMAPLPAAPAGFAVTVDGVDTVIQAVGLNTNTAIVEITLNEAVNCNDDLAISYTAGTVTAQDGTVLASFTPKIVTNNSTIRPPAPVQNMFYNNLNQLTEIRFPSGKVAKYTYDLNGNLIRLEIID